MMAGTRLWDIREIDIDDIVQGFQIVAELAKDCARFLFLLHDRFVPELLISIFGLLFGNKWLGGLVDLFNRGEVRY